MIVDGISKSLCIFCKKQCLSHLLLKIKKNTSSTHMYMYLFLNLSQNISFKIIMWILSRIHYFVSNTIDKWRKLSGNSDFLSNFVIFYFIWCLYNLSGFSLINQIKISLQFEVVIWCHKHPHDYSTWHSTV